MGTGQASILAIQVSDIGVFSGIIIGCFVGYVFFVFNGRLQFNRISIKFVQLFGIVYNNAKVDN